MSIKNELKALKQKKKKLEKELTKICSTLDNLYVKKSSLVQTVDTLSMRTSSLAQTLLEEAQEELKKFNQEVSKVEAAKAEVSNELHKVKEKILEIEDQFSLYINEQSSIMISTFIDYIKNHLKDISAEIKKTYQIIEITHFKDDRYGGCDVPTGKIGIYDESNKSFIVTSRDFYFKHELYTLDRGRYDELICHETDWYTKYRDNFISLLAETLQKSYCFDEFFKLTIENSCFTLELV